MKTAFAPNLVHEHIADLSGVPLSDLTAEMETRVRTRFHVPEGFHLNLTVNDVQELLADPSWHGDWDGPIVQLDGSRITTHWAPDTGVDFYIDHEGDNPWPISQATALGAAIQSLSAMLAPDYATEFGEADK